MKLYLNNLSGFANNYLFHFTFLTVLRNRLIKDKTENSDLYIQEKFDSFRPNPNKNLFVNIFFDDSGASVKQENNQEHNRKIFCIPYTITWSRKTSLFVKILKFRTEVKPVWI